MAIIYILGIILYFYMIRKHHIKGTNWSIIDEMALFIFLIGFVPVLNLLFGIYLWLHISKTKNGRKWYEILLFIKKDDSR